MFLLKFLATVFTGTVGIGVTSPFVYVSTSQPFHKTFWRKELNNALPVISCSEGGAIYKVVMSNAGGADNKDLGLGVTFILVQQTTRRFGYTEHKDEKKGASRDEIEKGGFKRDLDGGVMIWHKEEGNSRGHGQEKSISCKEIKQEVKWDGGGSSGGYKTVNASSVTVEAKECKSGFFSTTCNLKISSGSNLKGSDIKPSITYFAF